VFYYVSLSFFSAISISNERKKQERKKVLRFFLCVFVISTVSCCRERKENEYKKSGEKTAMDFLSFLLLGEEKKTEK